ncbi:hypothetical protein Tco_1106939 [Tanacetum coccineum]
MEACCLGFDEFLSWLLVIPTVRPDIVKLVVEIKSFGMSFDEFDKETGSSDGLQPKQGDLSCVHAVNELHFHEIHVVLNYEYSLMGLAEDSDERARELCSNLMFQLGKTGAHAKAYTVYNMLRYSNKPMCRLRFAYFEDLTAFCYQTSTAFCFRPHCVLASRLSLLIAIKTSLPFCFKTSWRFAYKLSLAFSSTSLGFAASLHCILLEDHIAF